jgi:hypothetical protein
VCELHLINIYYYYGLSMNGHDSSVKEPFCIRLTMTINGLKLELQFGAPWSTGAHKDKGNVLPFWTAAMVASSSLTTCTVGVAAISCAALSVCSAQERQTACGWECLAGPESVAAASLFLGPSFLPDPVRIKKVLSAVSTVGIWP